MNPVQGFWDETANSLTIIRVINPMSAVSFQVYTGYLHSDPTVTPVAPCISGDFQAFRGTGATALRNRVGWHATFYKAPQVVSLSPRSASNSGPVTVTMRVSTALLSEVIQLSGSGLPTINGAVGMWSSPDSQGVRQTSVQFPIGGVAPGLYDLVIRAAFGYVTTLAGAFSVMQSGPAGQLQITSYTADSTWIPIGSAATLSWEVLNASVVSLTGTDGRGTVLNARNLPASGSMQVRPGFNTTYVLAASDNAGGQVSRSVFIRLQPAPPPAGQMFFFKMQNPNSWVLPCFTYGIWAPDLATATAWAQAANGGYSATQITEAEMTTACG